MECCVRPATPISSVVGAQVNLRCGKAPGKAGIGTLSVQHSYAAKFPAQVSEFAGCTQGNPSMQIAVGKLFMLPMSGKPAQHSRGTIEPQPEFWRSPRRAELFRSPVRGSPFFAHQGLGRGCSNALIQATAFAILPRNHLKQKKKTGIMRPSVPACPASNSHPCPFPPITLFPPSFSNALQNAYLIPYC